MKQIGKPLTLEILEAARALDLALGQYMYAYEQGLYLPGSATPRIVFGVDYLVMDRRAANGPTTATYKGEEIYRMHPTELRGDIWRNGQLLVPSQTLPLLAKTPYIPHRSLLVVQRVLERTANRHYYFTRGSIPTDNADILQDALVCKIDFDEQDPKKHLENDLMLATFETIMMPLIEELEHFMGNDIYCVHVVDPRSDVAYITKYEDQRINDYNNLISAISGLANADSTHEHEYEVLRHAVSDILMNASAAADGKRRLQIDFDLKVTKR